MHGISNLPPLDGISALLAAAEGGSFTAAAEALGLTHGSISRRIAGLETWLGTQLFERHGRGVRLTPAGQRFAADARNAFSLLHGSAEQWRPRQRRQTVRLSVVPSFGRLWLLPRLASIERDDIHVELVLDHRKSDLDARDADLAIRYGRGAWEGLQARALFGETLLPVAAPSVADRLGTDARGEDILSVPLLHDSDISQWRAWLQGADIRYRPRWQDRRFEDYDTVIAAVEAGLGVALLRLPLAKHLLARETVRAVSGRILENPAQHFICSRKGEARASVLKLADRLIGISVGGT